MDPPSSFSGLFSRILIPMGIFFSLLGLIGALMSFPMKNGEAWFFFPIGIILLFLGCVCALFTVWSKGYRNRLLSQGQAVQGTIISVRHYMFINWNITSLTTIPGKNAPWLMKCHYTWEGEDYAVRSPLLWNRPCEGQFPTIYIDPDRPNLAVVDPDSIRYEI